MLKCGDTFLAPITSSGTEHLWIIITDPDADGKAVGVNITTQRTYSETTVILNAGDHPFVAHPSVINYRDARIIDVKAVYTAIRIKPRSFVCKSQESCSADLLKKVQEGMLKSTKAQKAIKLRCASEWEAQQKSAAASAKIPEK